MDSLTHIILGAAIGETILGNKIGRKAAAIGALAKTIPDFDIFYTGLKDPFLYMCHHRGHTHSLLWETLYAFPLAYIFYRLFSRSIPFSRWIVLFLACLWGHSLLDVCTNFGTQLFLPITNHAYTWNNLSIVDIFFTLPMLVLLIVGLIFPNNSSGRRNSILGLLTYCMLYLAYTGVNKIQANNMFEQSLQSHRMNYDQSMTNPTILNNFLWYGIAKNDTMLYVAENSLLFPKSNIHWHAFKRNRFLLDSHPDVVKREALKWFSNGYDISQRNGDTLNVYCVKFGRTNMKEDSLKNTFVFHYQLFPYSSNATMTMIEPSSKEMNYQEGIEDLYERILGK